MRMSKDDFIRFSKFLVVGVINTTITYLVYTLLRCIDLSPEISNAAGYVAGVINSFVWNKKWVFHTEGTDVWREIVSFVIIFGICYGIQFLAFRFMLYRLEWNEYIVQLIGIGVYTVLNFILNRLFTFRRPGTPAQ